MSVFDAKCHLADTDIIDYTKRVEVSSMRRAPLSFAGDQAVANTARHKAGISFVFTKFLLESFTPIDIIFIRTALASIFLTLFCLLFLRKEMKIEKKDISIIFAFSFFEPFLYFIFETYSLEYTSATVISIIIATIPIFTALLSKYYFKEKFSVINMLGVLISFLGIIVMLLPDFVNNISGFLGVLLGFLAVFSAVGYGFYLRKLSKDYHPVIIITYQNIVASLLFLPIFLFLGFKNGFPAWDTLTQANNLINILILVIFCSSLAFIFLVKGVQILGLGKSMIFCNLIPVITAIVSFFLLNEEFSIAKILGIVIVITGIFAVQKK